MFSSRLIAANCNASRSDVHLAILSRMVHQALPGSFFAMQSNLYSNDRTRSSLNFCYENADSFLELVARPAKGGQLRGFGP